MSTKGKPISIILKLPKERKKEDKLKYFSSFAALKIGKKKSVHHHLLANYGAHFFLPIFTAAIDEKYFKGQLISKCPLGAIVSTKKPTNFFKEFLT